MTFDTEHLRAILEAPHSYYGRDFEVRKDHRLHPGARNLLGLQFEPDMEVIDLGCGSGAALIENCTRFGQGVGIDNDPEHLRLAESRRTEERIANVEFLLCDLAEAPVRVGRERFDLAFSERGPIVPSSLSVQQALALVKPGGVIFAEMIGDQHHREVAACFGGGVPPTIRTSMLDQARVAFERNGVDVRLAADIMTKWCYPDIYEWLRFQCDIWAWAGRPLPSLDNDEDVKAITRFAELNTSPSGEIETTHHVVWVGGVKGKPPGWEPNLLQP